jgi:hypothetical protein
MSDSTGLVPTGAAAPSALPSEQVVLAAPMSFTGSLARILQLHLPARTNNPYGHIALIVLVVVMVTLAWVLILGWYTIFGLFVVPYRLIRRSQRRDLRDALQHREQLAALERNQRA